ncbi:MAG: hypothetical protein ACXADX_02220 [Candidatus Hodarchaeales archaeon]
MPHRDKHLGMAALIAAPISLVIFLGYVLIDIEASKGSWAIFAVIVDFFAVIISAIFPDILEPPKSARVPQSDQPARAQTHRQRWHSWEILGMAGQLYGPWAANSFYFNGKDSEKGWNPLIFQLVFPIIIQKLITSSSIENVK